MTLEQAEGELSSEAKGGFAMKTKKLSRRQFLKGAAVAAALLAVYFAGSLYGSLAHAADPPPLRVGYVGGITGALSSWGYPNALVFKYVVDEINREGGIKSLGGAKIEFIYSDCESDAKKAVTETEKMLSLRKPHVLMGLGASALMKNALPQILRYKVPCVSMEYSDELYTMNNPFFFGVMPKVTINAKQMADLFIKTGNKKGRPMKRAAVLCQDGSFGEMASDTWAKYLPSKGVEVVAKEIYPTGKVTDFTDTISKFKALNADALFCSTTPYEAPLIVRAMKATDFNPLAYAFSCTCIDTPDFINLGNDADFAFGVPVFSAEAIGDRIKGAKPFLKEFYSKVTNENDRKLCTEKIVLERTFTMGPVIHALEKAASYEPVVIRDALAKLDLHTGDRFIYWPDGVKFDETGYNARTRTIGGQYQNLKLKIFFPDSLLAQGDEPVWPIPKWTKR
jgi:branched-chain amino acid transport system substrate-binding protein